MKTVWITQGRFVDLPQERALLPQLRQDSTQPSGTPLNRLAKGECHARERWQWMVICIAIVALAIASRVGLIAWPFLNDSGLYAVLGRTVATGGLMYRDFYETKLPGAGLLAAGFWRAFGSHWVGYVLCQLVMALLAAMALARAASRHVGRSAVLPTLLFAIVFLNFDYMVYTGFQLETIQAFFEAVAAAVALEALCGDDPFAAFTAGLAAGVAAMAKPGGAGVAVVLMICLLRHRPIRILLVIAGLAVPTLATVYYTMRSGAWPYLPGVIRGISRYATGTPMGATSVLKIGIVLAVFGWPFLAMAFGRKSDRVTILRTVRGTFGLETNRPGFEHGPHGPEDRVTTRHSSSPVAQFAALWLLVDFLAAVAQRRLYPYHFLPLACPAALLYGLLAPARPMRVALGLLPIALLSLTWEGSSLSHLDRGFRHTAVADYIAAHTGSTDTVFADQAGRLLIETDRAPGSRLGTFFYFVNSDSAPQDYCRIMLDDFRSRRPKYLVLAAGWDRAVPALADSEILAQCPDRRKNFIDAWSTLRDYVHKNYVRETAIKGQEIYRPRRRF